MEAVMADMQRLGTSKEAEFYKVDGARAHPAPMIETRRLVAGGARWEVTRYLELSASDIEAIALLLPEADTHIQVLRTLESYPSVMGYVPLDDVATLEDVDRSIPISARTTYKVERVRPKKEISR